MSETKKIKLLRHGTAFGNPGDVVDLPPQIADALCQPRDFHDGYRQQKIRLAKPADEPDPQGPQEGKPESLAGLTQAEAAAMGIKNVVKSDPEDIGEANKQAAARAADRKKAGKKKSAQAEAKP